MNKKLIINILLVLGTAGWSGCGKQSTETNIIGKWEKISGDTGRGSGRIKHYRPGEVIIEFKRGGRLVAVWDQQDHIYKYRILNNGNLMLRGEHDKSYRSFTIQFKDGGNQLHFVEEGNGIRSQYQRLNQ